ncbi:MAG: TraB/GumN family protein [Kofleriaceae bacterium]|nr:TraB/GumN family protein [Myxococcales bacterium]MCB9563279.1 TraB/GumN family protein [Kofleriaceae bacterium]
MDAAAETVPVLTDGTTRFHLVGTAHVSERSVEQVREIIHRVRPEVVCVELCKGRLDALTKDSAFRDLDVFKVVREGKTLYLLAHLALASYQRRMGDALGVKPGAELLAAVEAAREVGARVELVDRDIQITLKRTWANLGLWKKSTLLASLMVGFEDDDEAAKKEVTAADIEKLKEPKALSELMSELARALPEVKEPLIDERDQFLIAGTEAAAQGAKDVVAVVGAAHVPGMTAWFGKPVDRERLGKPPSPGIFWTLLKWLIPVLLVAGIVWGSFHSDRSLGSMVLAWALPVSICAAAFTALGGARLPTIVSGFLVAPLAALHPLIGTGMITGVVEAWLRKPTVKDCERLPEDIQSLRGFWRNPVTRILLVATLSGLGTMLGMWLGVYWVVKMV